MHKLKLISAAALAAALAAPAALASASTVTIKLKEFKVTPSATSAKAGTVTFTVSNVGKIDHEFLVVKTNLPAGKLPLKGTQAAVKPLGKIGPFKPGKGGKLTLTLKAGKYVLLCNLPAHYKAGQYAAFTVK